jgi:hypothetical protein
MVGCTAEIPSKHDRSGSKAELKQRMSDVGFRLANGHVQPGLANSNPCLRPSAMPSAIAFTTTSATAGES